MIARWLRFGLAAGAAAVVLIGMLFVRVVGPRPAVAAALALAIVLALAAGTVIVKYAISRVHAFRPPKELSAPLGRVIAAAVGEASAAFFVFGIVQPFANWWMGRDAVGRLAPGRPVV